MKFKLVLCDFDGTITQTDILDLMCDLVGKRTLSQEINSCFISGEKDGKEALVERFSLLAGLELSRIFDFLKHIPLTSGVEEFFEYAHKHSIKTLVLSGNATFILEYYKKRLHFSDISGSFLLTHNGIIQSWDPIQCICVDKKLSAQNYIKKLGVNKNEILAIGDSIADQVLFDMAGVSFAINKKSSLSTDYEIESFKDIIRYLEEN